MVLLLALAMQAFAAVSADGATQVPAPAPQAIQPAEAQTLDLLLAALPARYNAAHATHDTSLAATARTIARSTLDAVSGRRAELSAVDPGATSRAIAALETLSGSLRQTTERYQPWPITFEVEAQSATARRELRTVLHTAFSHEQPYSQLNRELSSLSSRPLAGRSSLLGSLRPFALYAAGPGRRLEGLDPELDTKITAELLTGATAGPSLAALMATGAEGARRAAREAGADVQLSGQVLGLVSISHTTIVVNGAIIVFREGLEAVLILAAITASFVGARRSLRRPVLLGALAGLAATVLTWVIAQVLLHLLGNGGLELQAITGLVAIGVLLLVTNWFFHRVYWSEWIARFNRRRKSLERLDRIGFISGQALGLAILGLSSVYREGLETVLFLQAMQSSAGTGAAALGAGIGLAATLVVGWLTFRMQRKLPFKRMLILTGVLIALVLAVMVGTTVHNLQGIGWLSSTTTSFRVATDWSTWLGIYPTWQGIGAQLGALVFVVGSYFAAREIQVNGPRRRSRRRDVSQGSLRDISEAVPAVTLPVRRAG